MIDLVGASAAAATLITDPNVSASVPFITASMARQDAGTYGLIFPFMHLDYPTKEEVTLAINSAIHANGLNNEIPTTPFIFNPKDIPVKSGF